jgi:hypothetical protein
MNEWVRCIGGRMPTGDNRRTGRKPYPNAIPSTTTRLRLKCDGTRAETRFLLSTKRTSPFKLAGASVPSTTGSEVCASVVVMLDSLSSEVMWRVLATHSIRQFPLHFPSRASPCAITFQLDSTIHKGLAVTGALLIAWAKVCLFWARQPPVDHGLLIQEVSRSHTTTHHSR